MIVQMAFTNNAEWEPDLGIVLMDMALARALLEDKQYRLGREVLNKAIRECFPPLGTSGYQILLNEMYADILSRSTPILEMFRRSA